jgi:hypothetical protein
MNTNDLAKCALNFPNHISILVDGNHGIGKSAVTKAISEDYCKRLEAQHAKDGIPFDPKEDFGFIDIRLSQNDVGDLKGIPLEAGGFTFFAPPHWYPMHEEDEAVLEKRLKDAGKEYSPFNTAKHGVLFLDEFNRATREVSQVAFELVLDRRLNGWRIPAGWKIMAAINGDSDLYQIIEMDPALTDRFFMVKYVPTFDEWFSWAKGTYVDDFGNTRQNLHPAVLGYVQKKNDAIDPSKDEISKATTEGSKIQSRRSWHRLSLTIDRYESLAQMGIDGVEDPLDLTSDKATKELVGIAQGFIGTTWALDFVEYVKRDYKIMTPKDILNKYSEKVSDHIRQAEAPELAELVRNVVEEFKKMEGKLLTDKQKKNVYRFIMDMKNEATANLWQAWSSESTCRKQAEDWYDNTLVKARMLQCMGNPETTRSHVEALRKKASEEGLYTDLEHLYKDR